MVLTRGVYQVPTYVNSLKFHYFPPGTFRPKLLTQLTPRPSGIAGPAILVECAYGAVSLAWPQNGVQFSALFTLSLAMARLLSALLIHFNRRHNSL